MIELVKGDILQADAEALVNTVNCVGIMGRGIALQFRKEFPENYKEYRGVCEREELQPGQMLVVKLDRLHNPQYIINFPTKRHWKSKSQINDIEAGLAALVVDVRCHGIQSIAIPPLGCGLGGLDWKKVRPLIEEAFQPLSEVRVLVYEPAGAPAPAKMAKTKQKPKMTPGRAAVLVLIRHYLAAVMDPSITLLEIHKLMYFLQEAGELLKLRYKKAQYGPYAENLRHVLSDMEGHFISGYGDAEDNPTKQIELKTDAAEKARQFLSKHPDKQPHFDRVVDLIEGFETPYGMELLATAHWVAKQEHAVEKDDTVAKFYAWNNRKQMFPEQHIQTAWDVLHKKGWLTND